MLIKRLAPVLVLFAVFGAACGDDDAADTTPTDAPTSSIEADDETPDESAVEEPQPEEAAEPQPDDPVDAEEPEELEAPEDVVDTEEPAYDDPSGYYLVEYVSPELGGFPESREGAIVRTLDAYVVDYQNCCTDDTLYASVTSVEDNAVFTIYAPDGESVAIETMAANVSLQQGGEYWIVVGSTRGNAPYTIEVGLAQDAS